MDVAGKTRAKESREGYCSGYCSRSPVEGSTGVNASRTHAYACDLWSKVGKWQEGGWEGRGGGQEVRGKNHSMQVVIRATRCDTCYSMVLNR